MKKLHVVGAAECCFTSCIVQKSRATLSSFRCDRFADSESSIALNNQHLVKGSNLLLVYRFSSGHQSINDQLVNLFFLLSLIKSLQPLSVTIFLPYLAYGRQDNSDVSDLPSLLSCVGEWFSLFEVEKIIVCDPHPEDINNFFSIPVVPIFLGSFWVGVIKSVLSEFLAVSDVVIAAPDQGWWPHVQSIATKLGCSAAFIKKKRVGRNCSVARELVGNVEGKSVIVIDDIVDTAGTAVQASEMLIKNGAKDVFGCFSHGVLSAQSLSKLAQSPFKKVYITDTILLDQERWSHNACMVSVGDYVTDYVIREVENKNEKISRRTCL